tara:strand:- start:909 stop:1244 length:336 start_codon:yes stop_codon:yes gene_type:complete
MTDAADRILAHIARASSASPAKADDVRRALRIGATHFRAALEQLAADCRISSAQIYRRGDAGYWLAIWPTGMHHSSGGWTGVSHSVLFQPSAPLKPRLRAASAPRVRAVRP